MQQNSKFEISRVEDIGLPRYMDYKIRGAVVAKTQAFG